MARRRVHNAETPDRDVLRSRDNNLTGQLPASLARLSSVNRLHLEGNHLTGMLPAALLEAFDRGEMQVTGYTGQFSPISGSTSVAGPLDPFAPLTRPVSAQTVP